MRRTICFILCLLLLCGQCFAARQNPLEAEIQDFMETYDLDSDNFAFSFFNISSREACSFNEYACFPAGKVWTLPLNIYYYQQEAAGTFDPPAETPKEVFKINGMTLDDCHYHSILKGDDEVSLRMRDQIGSLTEYKLAVNEALGKVPEEYLTNDFFRDTRYNAAFLMNCMIYQADHPTEFQDMMQSYGLVQNAEGLASYEHGYSLIHVMDRADGFLCDVAKVNAAQPYLLVAFVKGNGKGDEALAALNDLLCTYVNEQNGIAEDVSHNSNVRNEGDFVISSGKKDNGGLLWAGLAVGGLVVVGGIIGLVVFLVRRRQEDDFPEE